MAFAMVVGLIQSPSEGNIFPLIAALGIGVWTCYLYKTYFDIYVAPHLD